MLEPANSRHWSADDFPAGANGLRLCRMVGDELRVFEAIGFTNGATGIAWFLNRWFIHGERVVTEPGEDYGMADVLDLDTWTILDEICFDREGFQRARAKLRCRVETEAACV